MMFSGSRTCLAALILCLLTSATIIGALAFQHIGGYEPCVLCFRQRTPYYIAVPLSAILMAVCMRGNNEHLVRLGLVVGTLIMLVSAGLGFHHAGVEWGWWAGPDACAGGAGLSSGSVLPDLDNAKVVSCADVQWRMFGLSFAGWNAVISAIASFVAFWGARRPTQA